MWSRLCRHFMSISLYKWPSSREVYSRHSMVHVAGLPPDRVDTETNVNIMDSKSRNGALVVLIPCGIPPKTSASALASQPRPMPVHWTNEFPGVWPCFSFILKLTFMVLVTISFGRTSLHQKWMKIHSSEENFTELMDRIAARTSTITVVVCHRLSLNTKTHRTLTRAMSRPVYSFHV